VRHNGLSWDNMRAAARLASVAAVLLVTSCHQVTRMPSISPEAAGLSAQALSGIAPALQAHVDSNRIAGALSVVARHGKVAYFETVGWADIERRVPMRRDAIFRIYSMTKPVVAAGIMKLVDQKRLTLDDPVAMYIPAFASVKVFAGGSADAPILRAADSPITVRHLLTHTAGLAYGLTDGPVDTIFRRAALYDPARTLEQFSDSLARLPLLFSPGTSWSYSSGIDVAGRVIEIASGKPLDRFLEDEIFRPLKMRDTSFRKRTRSASRIATLYGRGAQGELRAVSGGTLQGMFEPGARFLWGSGGLLSTADDYLRFAQMLLNGGVFGGRQVLSASSVRSIMTDQLPAVLSPVSGPPLIQKGYGQGLAGTVLVDSTLATLPGPPGIYRWSGYVGTYFWIDPRNDMVAMVWYQLSPGRLYPIEQEFQRLVYSALAR
jgi:CubicO group peptidase (beta-lactamase class C family)